jgi:mannose-1-phosphate guanylyltransferase
MFIWKLSTIMNEFERHQPELARRLSEIGTAMDEPDFADTLPRLWHGIRTETIDVGIAEKSDRMAVIPADFGWRDVGDWSAVADMLAAKQCDDAQNAVHGLHLGIQTSHSLEWGMLMAASTLMVLPIILIFFVAQKAFIQGIATSGLKG